ncbi:MAG: ABC transporter ATP-binding protein [Bdellovibrionales bacterium]|nr:ABC transporter ATP-binding protein [Bdellovibrionales bacterium]
MFAIQVQGLTKAFGDCVANDQVTFSVKKGSIHGIVGENGAGKSTAMKLLYGLYKPDSGSIVMDGKPRQWRTPADAISAGIGMVHQHFMLSETETVLDNLILGVEKTAALGKINRKQIEKDLMALSQKYRMPLNLSARISEIPVGLQQRVEILKMLYRGAEFMILDEPTAVLTPQEIEELFRNLLELKKEGKTILIITHKLREVMAITDRVTVFRAGKVEGDLETKDTSVQDLADRMVGRRVHLTIGGDHPEDSKLGHTPRSGGGSLRPALEIKGLGLLRPGESKPRLDSIHLTVSPKEIVGIAGVEGNGQSELIQAIFHPNNPRHRSSGQISILGQDIQAFDTQAIKELGVGWIPEDRHKEGLLLQKSLRENFLLGQTRREQFCKNGWIRWNSVDASLKQGMEDFDVRPRNIHALAGGLSGGNQQKLIIARELDRRPNFLVVAQPTRGVDVGAIEFIHRRLVGLREEGAGILLISSELDEILALSDRILVMYSGKIVAEFARGEVDAMKLGVKMGGGHG